MHTHDQRARQLLLGYPAGLAPSTWRLTSSSTHGVRKGELTSQTQGSKILVSALPVDVKEHEIQVRDRLNTSLQVTNIVALDLQDLFHKTVGPLHDLILIYNSAGNFKGMAIISFQRTGDAVLAKTKYDGKLVDGREGFFFF
jgi:THO complex subunit 4